MKVFVCHPGRPWQRPTNENTNGLLRNYFPKGTDPEPVKDFETALGYLFCMSVSRDGSLIHATVGSLGGVGRRQNRVGFAV